MLLRENLYMAEFFNSHQKLCQGTNDKKLIHIHNLYTPRLKRKPKGRFRSVTFGKFNLGPLHLLDNFVKEILASDSSPMI